MATHSNILAWRIPMNRGAWRATVHGVAKSQTQLSTCTPNRRKWQRAQAEHDQAASGHNAKSVCVDLKPRQLWVSPVGLHGADGETRPPAGRLVQECSRTSPVRSLGRKQGAQGAPESRVRRLAPVLRTKWEPRLGPTCAPYGEQASAIRTCCLPG